MKKATVTRIHPEGSTLTRASGVPIAKGATVVDGEVLIHATPDGKAGAISISSKASLTIKTVKLAPAVEVRVESVTGPATPGEVEAVRAGLREEGEIV